MSVFFWCFFAFVFVFEGKPLILFKIVSTFHLSTLIFIVFQVGIDTLHKFDYFMLINST